MNTRNMIPWVYLRNVLREYAPLWISTTILCGVIGGAYGFLKKDVWEATQPLQIRDEIRGTTSKLGRFSSENELLAAQETLAEMVRHRNVVETALRQLGPPPNYRESWADAKHIHEVITSEVTIRAPKSSEFGKSEVIYLDARESTPQRAEKFCGELYTALMDHLREVRVQRADSIIVELTEARDLARKNLAEAREKLEEFEKSVGSDLAELRNLSESISGEVGSSRRIGDLERDLRTAEQEVHQLEAQQKTFNDASSAPQNLLISEGSVMNSQPTLQRLKTGLIEAQLEASKLAGRVTPEHPQRVAAALAIATIEENLRNELRSVARSIDPALAIAKQKCAQISAQMAELEKKLARLANIRSQYSQLVAETTKRTTISGEAESQLADAQALRASAESVNLIATIGPPRAGEKPLGLGPRAVFLAATAAGWMLGIGGAFLLAPSPTVSSPGRRWNDAQFGRRATDLSRSGNGQYFTTQAPAANGTPGGAHATPAKNDELLESLQTIAAKLSNVLPAANPPSS